MKTAKRFINTVLPLFLFTHAVSADPVSIDFDDIPIGTELVNGQYGWHDWGTSGGGQSVVMSDSGSLAAGGTGSSGFVSTGPDSINSAFLNSDSVILEWDVELRGVGPSNDRGPDLFICRDLDGDGILENADGPPANDGQEGLIRFRIDYEKIRIAHNVHDESGVRSTIEQEIQFIDFESADTDLHCAVEISHVSSHEMQLHIKLSGQAGVVVDQLVGIDFVGPHLWDQIDGVVIRTDNCCSTVDNILFTPESATCLADLTGDGDLDFFDVSGFIVLFQIQDPVADFTGDGSFDFFDVSAFLTSYANGCP